jgi:energy-converting hydrogenase Eha subunit H
MKPSIHPIRQYLRKRADQPRENFMLLLSGFGIFMLGLLTLVTAQFLLPGSLIAELVALIGLLLLGGGIILASIGYLSLSVLRILRFLDSDDDKPS